MAVRFLGSLFLWQRIFILTFLLASNSDKFIMSEKIVVITGANAGIGRAATAALVQMGYHVVMVCRNVEKGRAVQESIAAESGSEKIDLLIADLSSHSSIRKMAAEYGQKYDRLDILINNAGGMWRTNQKTKDGFEYMMGLNHFGYFLATHYLLSLIQKSSSGRIINVASEAHRGNSLDWENMNGEKSFWFYRQYGVTKLCNILFTNYLSEELKGANITVNSLHPGVIASNFWNNTVPSFIQRVTGMFMISPEKGAETTVYLADSDEVENVSGAYFKEKKAVSPSDSALDFQTAKRLWEWSLIHSGIKDYGVV